MSISVICAACTTAEHRILHNLCVIIEDISPYDSGLHPSHTHIYIIST